MEFFRKEVTANLHSENMGAIQLKSPISLTVFVICAGLAAFAIITYLYYGEYTKRARLEGVLAPGKGLIKLYPTQVGMIQECRVSEGDIVHKGQVLFVISNDRETSKGASGRAVAQQVEAKKQSMHEELQRMKSLEEFTRSALNRKSEELTAELSELDREITIISHRRQIADESLKRFEALRKENFSSDAQVRQKIDDLLDHDSHLAQLNRTRLSLLREIRSLKDDISMQPAKDKQSHEALLRSIAGFNQELLENEARTETTVLATQPGRVTALIAEVGQTAAIDKPLAVIIPLDSPLEARLNVPSQSAGFIKVGQQVKLRIAAFPYQKFGSQDGTVTQISRAALDEREISTYQTPTNTNEQFYKVTVKLKNQEIIAYGTPQALSPGMALEADVLLDKRRLIEWLLAPLFSVVSK